MGNGHSASRSRSTSTGVGWLDGIYKQLDLPSPSQLPTCISLYGQLTPKDMIAPYEARPFRSSVSSTTYEDIITTNRDYMRQVNVDPTADMLDLTRRQGRTLDQIRIKAQAGFGGFVNAGVDAPLSVFSCMGGSKQKVTHTSLLGFYKAYPRIIKIWSPDQTDVTKPRASSAISSTLDPGFVETNDHCIVLGTCYNDSQGTLRVLEWVDPDPPDGRPATLRCKWILFDVPIWLMSSYTGGGVSTSVLVRHKSNAGSNMQPSFEVFTDDGESWGDVRKSSVHWEWKPEAHSRAAPRQPRVFPTSSDNWLNTLFSTGGKDDHGSAEIRSPSNLYLCASIPVMLALALTKVEDLGECNLERFGYQAEDCTIQVNSLQGNKGITRFAHVAVSSKSTLVGSEWVAVVLAFNKSASENCERYLWD